MLKIEIPEREEWDELNETFIHIPGASLRLEHSLVSLSKWESKWQEPFLNNTNMTPEKTIDYIRCMSLDSGVKPDVYENLTKKNIDEVDKYIGSKMTATWFKENPHKHGRSRGEVVTSEIIYYWMITLNIPFECQKWHLNRLLTLIQVCNEKNQPAKKMSKREIMAQNRSLNEARRAKMGTKG